MTKLYSKIPEDFDLSKAYKYSWDACYQRGDGTEVELELYSISDLPHCKSSAGHQDLWACPRGEEPTHKNLKPYLGHGCQWGIVVKEFDYYRPGNGFHKSCEYRKGLRCYITRNGQKFYPVNYGRDIALAVATAQYKLSQIQEHSIPFFSIDFEKQLVGRAVFYEDQPAIIKRYNQGEGEVLVVPAKEGEFFRPSCWAKTDDEIADWVNDYGNGLYVDILSDSIYWHRDTP
tara:strand:+ start:744 stop:1436 length:693 start_codon:yes stop_codon:yes gene_type:complete